MRITRTLVPAEPIVHGDVTVVPVAHRVELHLGRRAFGAGMSYEGPSHLEIDGRRRHIVDWHLLARVAVTAALILLLTVGRRGGPHGPGE